MMRNRVACVVVLNLLSVYAALAQTNGPVRSSVAPDVATYSTLQYGYKNTQGACEVAGESVTIYWDSVPCFYLHVVPSVDAAPITGSVVLNGTTPDGTQFTAGPYTVSSDPDGGGHLYIVYNDGLGDAGEYAFTMSYLGDDKHEASRSGEKLVVHVRPLPTTLRIEGPTAILAGNTAVFSGTLGSPLFSSVGLWGAISLYDGGTLLQEAYTFSNSFLVVAPLASAGTHTISASFGGMPGKYNVLNADASTSNPLNVVAMDRNPQVGRSVELTISPNPPAHGEAVSLIAKVTDNTQGARGTVTFFDGMTPLSTVPLISNAAGEGSTATLKLAFSVGKHVITARCDAFAAVASESAQTYAPVSSTPSEIIVSTTAETETRLMLKTDGNKYRLSASVFGYGSLPLAGVVNFRDSTSNAGLGSAALDNTQSVPAFAEPHEIRVIGQPHDVAATDLNRDGIVDLVITDAAANAIHVMIGKGNALFETQQDYSLSATPTTLIMADIDRDGTPEIVVGTSDRTIEVLSRKSDGTLTSTKTLQNAFVPRRVLTGDLNGDAITDIVVLGYENDLSVVLGNANGSFDDPVSYATAGPGNSFSALIADVNNDGIPDLLVSDNNFGTHEMLGTGDGTLQPAVLVDVGGGAAVAADFNDDGNTDLAFAPFEGAVAFQAGRGDATFATPHYYYPRSIPPAIPGQDGDRPETTLSIAIADFNADGIPDVITADAIYLGAGDGTFSDGITYEGEFTTISDLNGDGVPDLLHATDKGLQARFGGTAATVHLAGVAVRGNGVHSVEAEFVPLATVPYGESVSRSVQVEAIMPGFTFAVFPSSLNFEQGSTAMATVAVASMNGYSGTLTFRCEELQPGVTCAFRPSSLTINETEPYNQTDLVVSIAGEKSASQLPTDSRTNKFQMFAAIVMGALGLFVSGSPKHRAIRRRVHPLLVVMLVTTLFFTLSCGVGNGTVDTTPASIPSKSSTYSVVIAVSDGTFSRTTQLTVTLH